MNNEQIPTGSKLGENKDEDTLTAGEDTISTTLAKIYTGWVSERRIFTVWKHKRWTFQGREVLHISASENHSGKQSRGYPARRWRDNLGDY